MSPPFGDVTHLCRYRWTAETMFVAAQTATQACRTVKCAALALVISAQDPQR